MALEDSVRIAGRALRSGDFCSALYHTRQAANAQSFFAPEQDVLTLDCAGDCQCDGHDRSYLIERAGAALRDMAPRRALPYLELLARHPGS